VGTRVAVIGLGPVGLSHVLVRAFSGATVVGIEPSLYRRDLSLQMGAAAAFAPPDNPGSGFELVIECTGRPEGVHRAFDLVREGGVVLQSGECAQVQLRPAEVLVRREITYVGSWYYATEDYRFMLDLVRQGLALFRLCTHDVASESAEGAIAQFLAGQTGKVILRWDGNETPAHSICAADEVGA